jgi:mRNA-degrading endonuclease RelE of RelBE toxin-antitoxin system
MSYKLEFFSDAWKEWEKLDATLKAQFKKKLLERLENPHVESAQLSNMVVLQNQATPFRLSLGISGRRGKPDCPRHSGWQTIS